MSSGSISILEFGGGDFGTVHLAFEQLYEHLIFLE